MAGVMALAFAAHAEKCTTHCQMDSPLAVNFNALDITMNIAL